MTIHEQKLDIMKRGFVLSERMLPQSPDLVQLVVFKQDTDGLKVECTPNVEQITYLTEDDYIGIIKTAVSNMDTYMNKRHAQNPNTCEHDKVDLPGGFLGCLNCMAKLGTTATTKGNVGGIKIDLNNN